MTDKDNKGKGFFDSPSVGESSSSNKGFFDAPTVGKGSLDTKRVGKSDATVKPNPALDAQTRRFNPSSGENAGEATSQSKSSASHYHPEFAVGWLVVIDGPGRGVSRPLGYGMNPVGREEEQGVRLDFGDSELSRRAHCNIAFDHKHHKFFIQHGDGQNLTYLNDQPVLNPAELQDGAILTIGSTTLKFVAFCNEEFNWGDSEE